MKDAGKIFWGKNLKSLSLISKIVGPNFITLKGDTCGMRILVDKSPIFTKVDPPEVLEYYLKSCLKDGIDPLVDPFNLRETYHDVHGKRKKESRKEGSSRPHKKKKKAAESQDEDEVPLNERQRQMLLRYTSGIVQQSTKAPSVTTSGKLPEASNLVSDSVVSERILPIQPPPNSQPKISKPILLPPPTETPILEPVTETPTVFETFVTMTTTSDTTNTIPS